ncbi:unnamed protein product [Clavelina lepadiformis]|uniref:Large ribosomal subunit protein mL62 n=1 Tax=Clavelina lepadiformis TaxID=159417 RepID=A0ABP0GX58_CLALP
MSLIPRRIFQNCRMCCYCFSRTLAYKSIYNVENLYPGSKDLMSVFSSKSSDKFKEQSGFSGEIPIKDLTVKYSKSSGPGGQHVNKTLSKVEVRFHVSSAEWIPETTRSLILEKFWKKITRNGELIVWCDDSRYQLNNMKSCLSEIRELIKIAETPPDTSKEERIAELYDMDSVQAAHKKRLMKKRKNSFTKAMRNPQYD